MTSNTDDIADPSRLIGRVVELFGLVSKLHLNEEFGNVETYVQSTNRYGVRLLNNRTNCFSLKSDNFKVVNPGNHYPRSKGMSLNLYLPMMKGGIFNVPQGSFSHPNLVFINPCIVRGVRSSPDSDGNYQPKSCITSPIEIQMGNDAGAIEFEDLNIAVKDEQNVFFTSGRAIFRRCRFSGQDGGMSSGGPLANRNVTLENCVFESCGGSGYIVDRFSNVSFLNCIIRNNKGMGIEIRNGGAATISHCRFIDITQASISGYRNGKNVDVNDCIISGGGDSGILIVDGCTSVIKRTKISGCKMAGIAVEQKGAAVIQDCDIQECTHGILVQTGKCTVNITNSYISSNKRYGVFVGQDCVGNIVLVDNTIQNNGW